MSSVRFCGGASEMAGEQDTARDVTRDRVGERDDATQPACGGRLEDPREEPRLGVAGHLVGKDHPRQLEGLGHRLQVGEDVRQRPLGHRDPEHDRTDELLVVVEQAVALRGGGIGRRVVMLNDPGPRRRLVDGLDAEAAGVEAALVDVPPGVGAVAPALTPGRGRRDLGQGARRRAALGHCALGAVVRLAG